MKAWRSRLPASLATNRDRALWLHTYVDVVVIGAHLEITKLVNTTPLLRGRIGPLDLVEICALGELSSRGKNPTF